MSPAPIWTDDELADLQRDYDTDHGGHDDVVALIRGARALLAECARRERTQPAYMRTSDVVRVLSLEGPRP